jgi:hypothetical protein
LKIANIKLKRSSKFLILVIASLLVGLANATVYYSMLAQPSVSITAAKVVFVSGNDFPTGSSLGANSTWVYLALNGYPNTTVTYEQPLNISNTDSASHTFRLRHVSISPISGQPQVSNFTAINFVVQNTAGASQGSFNYTTTTTTWNTPTTMGYMTLPAGASWIIYAETKTAASANDVTADIQIAVDVV